MGHPRRMTSKGVKKSSAVEVKSSKAGNDRTNMFDKDGHLIIPKNNDVTKQAKEFLEKKEQLKIEKSTSKKQLTEEEKQQKKRENWRKYYHNNKEKYKMWNKNWREKQKGKKQQEKSSPMKKETK